MPENNLITKILVWYEQNRESFRMAAVIFIAGIAHAIHQFKKYRYTERIFDSLDFMTSLFLAIVSGMVFGFIGNYFDLQGSALYLMVTLGAIFGYDGILDLYDVFRARMQNAIKAIFIAFSGK